MAELVVEETLTPDTNPPCFFSQFDYPSGDVFYNSTSVRALSDLTFMIDGDDNFELTFDSVDDLYFPSENRDMCGDFTTSGCCNQESPMNSDCSGTAQSLSSSSQESANCASDVSKATIPSSSSPESGKVVVDQKLKVEEEATTKAITKRKKEIEEDTRNESRNNKYMRSEEDGVTCGEEDDEKRHARLIRNRESAHLSRQRKKHYVEELQDKVKNLHSTITDLNSKISYFMAENATLRLQVSTGSYPPPLQAGMYRPLAPMPYPWIPFPAYMVKPQDTQVPLLLIPRFKPQQSLAKVKKTKKVASVSVLGLLFCLFLLGALAPIVSFSYGGISSVFYGEYETDRICDQSRGRVLDVNGHLDSDQEVRRNVSATEISVPPGNGSETLLASLFVPRNEKLVKIDGNLIIHSILASEKAMTTTTKVISPALPLPDFTRTEDISKKLYSKKQKALSSSGSDDTSIDKLKSTTANGKMQQWFREGVAGPMFSSGMCTEVFQFDASSTSGAIISASSATQNPKNTIDSHKGQKNRRILRGGLPVSDYNLTKDLNSSSKKNFRETKPITSMVVSVLIDPREGGDEVFIVVLVDGVKYITYSCALP